MIRFPRSIKVLPKVIDRSVFMYVSEDGKNSKRKLRVGDVMEVGSCLQGHDSALLMMVTKGSLSVNTFRISLEMCNETTPTSTVVSCGRWCP